MSSASALTVGKGATVSAATGVGLAVAAGVAVSEASVGVAVAVSETSVGVAVAAVVAVSSWLPQAVATTAPAAASPSPLINLRRDRYRCLGVISDRSISVIVASKARVDPKSVFATLARV
jgi:hypothetical protein